MLYQLNLSLYLVLSSLVVACNSDKKSGDTPSNQTSQDATGSPADGASVQSGTTVAEPDDVSVLCERYVAADNANQPQGFNPEVPECQIYAKKVLVASYGGATYNERVTKYSSSVVDSQALVNWIAQAAVVTPTPAAKQGGATPRVQCSGAVLQSATLQNSSPAAARLIAFVTANCNSGP